MDSMSASIISLNLSSLSHETSEHLEGDHHYISLEKTRLISHDIDLRSDFYNIGIVFYYMLTGKLPFHSDNVSKLMRMHVFHEAQPLHLVDPSIPLVISKLVQKLMEKEPAKRYQSAKSILYDV